MITPPHTHTETYLVQLSLDGPSPRVTTHLCRLHWLPSERLCLPGLLDTSLFWFAFKWSEGAETQKATAILSEI